MSIHFLLVTCWQHPQDMIERHPAKWAHSSHHSPLLDAAKAEEVEAQGHAGCVVDFSQADGACGCLLMLVPSGCHGRATLLHSFLSSLHRVLPRQIYNMSELSSR